MRLSVHWPVPYNVEWTKSLEGLMLIVPSGWFGGYDDDDDTPNDGEVSSINWTQVRNKFFQVDMDGHVYSMRYDAVFLYADKNQRNFERFNLPRYPVSNPEGELVHIPCPNPEGESVHVPRRGRWSTSEEGDTLDTASSTNENNYDNKEEGNTRGGGGEQLYNVYERTAKAP